MPRIPKTKQKQKKTSSSSMNGHYLPFTFSGKMFLNLIHTYAPTYTYVHIRIKFKIVYVRMSPEYT